jgi:hypothetical protein
MHARAPDDYVGLLNPGEIARWIMAIARRPSRIRPLVFEVPVVDEILQISTEIIRCLARNSQRKTHTSLSSYFSIISPLIASTIRPEFRRERRDFSRNGTLSPDLLVTLLLYMVGDANRRGYSHLMDAFWDEARSFGLELPGDKPVSKSAFSAARAKITPQLMRSLIHGASDAFDSKFGQDLRWFGRRVFAIDGSKVNVQRGEDLARAFGVPSGAHCPQVLVSTLFDVIAKVPHDLVIAPYATSEREELVGLLDRVKQGDVLVLDRGYPSFEILWMLQDAGIDFVIRVPVSSTFKAVDDLIYSGGDDCRILIEPPAGHPMRDRGPIEVRAIRITTPDGEPTIIVTSLRRCEFSIGDIRDVYHRRWEVEEFYKLTKGDYLGQGQFHAKSPNGVRQEIHAVALFVAVTRYLMAAAAKEHDVAYEELSPKAGVLGFAAYVTRILLACGPEHVAPVLDQLFRRIIRTRDTKRPGRRQPRRSFKPSRKWAPGGRRGG